jgi:phosphomannomutase
MGEGFDTKTLARVADAAARVFCVERPQGAQESNSNNRIIISYDCRENAGRYAALAGSVMAAHGFEVVVSDTYCPTPTLCWSVANDPQAVGGMMLTSSHNPAEYLGVKLRMADGGASPAAFTDRVEAALEDELPACYTTALAAAEASSSGVPGAPTVSCALTSHLRFSDLMTPYLHDLMSFVDAELIKAARLRVVVDSLFGAGRVYLAQVLRQLGVEVREVNAGCDPRFGGLHPEPIAPWIATGAEAVSKLGYDACFVTDGDADRIGAADSDGAFVSPHRILALIVAHLVEGKGMTGRVVRTLSGSNLIKRECERLGLELTTTPIGFKWIYEEMLKGDVLVGGEESGGIGMPAHVCERDGLLMALLLTELMAKKAKTLRELVAELLQSLGNFDYSRRDLRLDPAQKDAFVAAHIQAHQGEEGYAKRFSALGEEVVAVDHRDGVWIGFASDAWLLMRLSGTEPLVRVYAEATSRGRVEELLDAGCAIAQGR